MEQPGVAATTDPARNDEQSNDADSKPAHTRVFRSGFDLWVPALLICALIVSCGALLNESLIAFASIVAFLLGVVPQAKMKRADLLVTLQERFSALQSDVKALGIDPDEDSEASVRDDEDETTSKKH